MASHCGETETSPVAILSRYRLALYGDAITVENHEDGSRGQRGFTREEVLSVIQAGGKVPPSQLIRCRVRHFVDGAVIGSKSFVDHVFRHLRDRFGPSRKDGARTMRNLTTDSKLFALRDLRKSPVG